MDLIYKVYSIWLCDNQLDHDYLIFSNKYNRFGRISHELPYDISMALQSISDLSKKEISYGQESIRIMNRACENSHQTLKFVKNDNLLTLVRVENQKESNYQIYDLFWNETKSGINIHDFEICSIWNIGNTSYSSYRIWEHKGERQKKIRDYNLESLLK